MLSDFLHFLHEKTVRHAFSKDLNETIKILLDKIHKIYTSNDDETIFSILSADAASMNRTHGGPNGFVGYELQPVKCVYPPKMVYVQERDNCRFNQESLDIATEIVKAAPDANFKTIGFATDADPKTNGIHKSFYEQFQAFESIDDILMEMRNFQRQFPIADLLHLVKTMRRKYLYNSVSITFQAHR